MWKIVRVVNNRLDFILFLFLFFIFLYFILEFIFIFILDLDKRYNMMLHVTVTGHTIT